MAAKDHTAEAARLMALQSYDIMDTPPERAFDDIVHLIAAICEAPLAFITLMDAERQWFKAKVGFDDAELPLDQTICIHALFFDGLLEIPDLSVDSRTRNTPVVANEPHVRFYAGVPLRTPEGLPLGTLCVLDLRPRTLTPLQRQTLEVMGRQVMRELDLRAALARADVLRREVDHRVKNSLQSVAALTRLQARSHDNPEVSAALRIAVQRIETVAALHEQLYRTNAGSHVELADYLHNIVGFLGETCPPNITLTANAAPLRIDSRRAAAVAVLVNEFAQNSLVHAFPDGRTGRVEITGETAGDGAYRLRLVDDGVGYGLDHERPGGLGLRVIEASCAQLGGAYRRIAVDRGTSVEIIFPIEGESVSDLT